MTATANHLAVMPALRDKADVDAFDAAGYAPWRVANQLRADWRYFAGHREARFRALAPIYKEAYEAKLRELRQ